MDEFEKVEKLRQRANITYEEAKKALEESGGDLLDAMVYLEQQGKVNPPKSSTYTTDYEQQSQYQDVQGTVSDQQRQANKRTFGDKFKHLCQIIWNTLTDNTLHVQKGGKDIIDVPLWLALAIVLFTWEFIWIVVLISLFFDCRYHLVGKDASSSAGEAINKASDIASDAAGYVKNEFDKL